MGGASPAATGSSAASGGERVAREARSEARTGAGCGGGAASWEASLERSERLEASEADKGDKGVGRQPLSLGPSVALSAVRPVAAVRLVVGSVVKWAVK